jgi:hypothetical protein
VLVALNVIPASTGLAIGAAALLLVLDVAGWRRSHASSIASGCSPGRGDQGEPLH